MTRDGRENSALDLVLSLVEEAASPENVSFDALESLTAYVLAAEGAAGEWAITVALVGDDSLQALHRDFMGLDTPTDVMTFPRGDGGDEPQGGEIVISVDHAQSQAGDWGLSPTDEIRFLVVHGLLHLLGWRDDADAERREMLVQQQALFDQWRSESVYAR